MFEHSEKHIVVLAESVTVLWLWLIGLVS